MLSRQDSLLGATLRPEMRKSEHPGLRVLIVCFITIARRATRVLRWSSVIHVETHRHGPIANAPAVRSHRPSRARELGLQRQTLRLHGRRGRIGVLYAEDPRRSLSLALFLILGDCRKDLFECTVQPRTGRRVFLVRRGVPHGPILPVRWDAGILRDR